MESRALGNSGLMVSALGLGTVKLGRNRDVKYPGAFELPDDRAVDALLEAALEEGVLVWDTAPAYGRSEERLGERLPAVRERVVLCTKAGESHGPDGSSFDFSKSAITSSVERSLVRLRTDFVDLCLLHSDGRDVEILEHTDAVEALVRLREAGKVRAIGMSAKTADGIELASRRLEVVMAPYGVNDRSLRPALERARQHGCGVMAIKVLGQGHAVAAAGEHESRLRAALELVLDDEVVDVALIGTRSAEHLRETARTARSVLEAMRGGSE